MEDTDIDTEQLFRSLSRLYNEIYPVLKRDIDLMVDGFLGNMPEAFHIINFLMDDLIKIASKLNPNGPQSEEEVNDHKIANSMLTYIMVGFRQVLGLNKGVFEVITPDTKCQFKLKSSNQKSMLVFNDCMNYARAWFEKRNFPGGITGGNPASEENLQAYILNLQLSEELDIDMLDEFDKLVGVNDQENEEGEITRHANPHTLGSGIVAYAQNKGVTFRVPQVCNAHHNLFMTEAGHLDGASSSNFDRKLNAQESSLDFMFEAYVLLYCLFDGNPAPATTFMKTFKGARARNSEVNAKKIDKIWDSMSRSGQVEEYLDIVKIDKASLHTPFLFIHNARAFDLLLSVGGGKGKHLLWMSQDNKMLDFFAQYMDIWTKFGGYDISDMNQAEMFANRNIEWIGILRKLLSRRKLAGNSKMLEGNPLYCLMLLHHGTKEGKMITQMTKQMWYPIIGGEWTRCYRLIEYLRVGDMVESGEELLAILSGEVNPEDVPQRPPHETPEEKLAREEERKAEAKRREREKEVALEIQREAAEIKRKRQEEDEKEKELKELAAMQRAKAEEREENLRKEIERIKREALEREQEIRAALSKHDQEVDEERLRLIKEREALEERQRQEAALETRRKELEKAELLRLEQEKVKAQQMELAKQAQAEFDIRKKEEEIRLLKERLDAEGKRNEQLKLKSEEEKLNEFVIKVKGKVKDIMEIWKLPVIDKGVDTSDPIGDMTIYQATAANYYPIGPRIGGHLDEWLAAMTLNAPEKTIMLGATPVDFPDVTRRVMYDKVLLDTFSQIFTHKPDVDTFLVCLIQAVMRPVWIKDTRVNLETVTASNSEIALFPAGSPDHDISGMSWVFSCFRLHARETANKFLAFCRAFNGQFMVEKVMTRSSRMIPCFYFAIHTAMQCEYKAVNDSQSLPPVSNPEQLFVGHIDHTMSSLQESDDAKPMSDLIATVLPFMFLEKKHNTSTFLSFDLKSIKKVEADRLWQVGLRSVKFLEDTIRSGQKLAATTKSAFDIPSKMDSNELFKLLTTFCRTIRETNTFWASVYIAIFRSAVTTQAEAANMIAFGFTMMLFSVYLTYTFTKLNEGIRTNEMGLVDAAVHYLNPLSILNEKFFTKKDGTAGGYLRSIITWYSPNPKIKVSAVDLKMTFNGHEVIPYNNLSF